MFTYNPYTGYWSVFNREDSHLYWNNNIKSLTSKDINELIKFIEDVY